MTIAEAYIIDNLFGDMNELQLITIRDRSGKLSGKDMHRLIKRAKEKIHEHTTNNTTEHKGTTGAKDSNNRDGTPEQRTTAGT